jgi:decaprenylphospho-beta-D-ribofuranose 2-oxidase
MDATGLSGVVALELGSGLVAVRAGESLDSLMRKLVPLGLFVPVTPGTRQVTVGGAMAADVHGKNHHRKGSFMSHVESFRLVDGRGVVHDVSPGSDPDAFWATAGGMGLTGVILDATVKMSHIESSQVLVDTDKARDLDEVMSLMVSGDDAYEYSVAWIDLVAKGASMGRSVLQRGRFATAAEAHTAKAADVLAYRPHQLAAPPDAFPSRLLNKATVRVFNELWYRKAPRCRRDELMGIEAFFHPLDMVSGWNRLYGRRGFLQWQFAVPDTAADVVVEAVRRLSSAGVSSFLAVLKRFGPGNQGPLSFPMSGWTLALDLPADPAVARLLDDLDDLVAAGAGRIYLAKDSRLDARHLPVMYPRLDEWREVAARLDPDGVFQSDLSRRLALRP